MMLHSHLNSLSITTSWLWFESSRSKSDQISRNFTFSYKKLWWISVLNVTMIPNSQWAKPYYIGHVPWVFRRETVTLLANIFAPMKRCTTVKSKRVFLQKFWNYIRKVSKIDFWIDRKKIERLMIHMWNFTWKVILGHFAAIWRSFRGDYGWGQFVWTKTWVINF